MPPHGTMLRSSTGARAHVLATGLALLGCTAYISSPGGTGDAAAGAGAPVPLPPLVGDPPEVFAPPLAVTQLRRLTLLEYRNSLRDLLGVTEVPTADLAADQQAGTSGYTTGAAITSAPDARLFLEHTELLSQAAMSNLAASVPCIGAADAGVPCASQFIRDFGRRAFRRPLVAEEVTSLLALYNAQRDASLTFADAIVALTTAILLSPNFLYHRELAPGAALLEGAGIRLNAHELASRLSFSLWASMPDARLFQLADSGELEQTSVLQREARRMLVDAKARAVYGDFTAQWLGLEPVVFAQKVPELKFTQEVGKAMLAETTAFVADIFMGSNTTGRLDLLFTSTKSFVDETLAGIYGVSGVTGRALQPVTLDPRQRSGLLTQLSFLTRHGDSNGSFPARRGFHLVKDVLCRELPPPPPNVPPLTDEPADLTPKTTRQRFEAHTQNPCASCHKIFDAFGFAFENYDGIGRYRTVDSGQAVDATGRVELSGSPVTFEDAVGLMPALASSNEVRACVATQWLRYVLRRQEAPGDLPSLEQAQKTFRDSGFDLRELLVGLVGTDAFARRTPAPGEVLP